MTPTSEAMSPRPSRPAPGRWPCVLVVVALGMFGAAGAAGAQRPQHPRRSPEQAARDGQAVFGQLRRRLLPVVPATGHACRYNIGRLCYWEDRTGDEIPPEDPRIVTARDQLRTTLDSLGAAAPANDYIIGQRIRFDLEGRDPDAANRAAAACAATPWWCEALRGLVWHRASSEMASTAAYDSALATMPETLRCTWLDVDAWLSRYSRLSGRANKHHCDDRQAQSARVFWLSAPLLTWRRYAIRNEFLSRRTVQMLLADSVNRELPSFDWDVGELSLRYGWPDRWARQSSSSELPLVGNLPKPSFDFVPGPGVFSKPFDAKPADWAVTNEATTQMQYAPGWLRAIDTMTVQIARFRRGDTMVVVAVYDGSRVVDSVSPTAIAAASLSVGLAPESTLDLRRTPAGKTGVIVLRTHMRPALAAVEVIDSAHARAARWRAGIKPLAEGSTISDLLIGAGGVSYDPFSPHSVPGDAVPALRFTPHDTVALYWETYLHAPPDTPVRVSVRLTRDATGLFGRLGRAIGLTHGQAGPTIAWSEIRPDSAIGRSIRLGIPDVPPGTYRIEVSMQSDQLRGTTSRDILIEAAN